MDKIHTPPDEAVTLPGPMYPDRCLECPELLCDDYGCVKHNKCVDCAAASLRQKTLQSQSYHHDRDGLPDPATR
jgi:hypothetical protein